MAGKPSSNLPALDAPDQDPKIEFFLTASHQLKSPVAIIQWCLQSVAEMHDVPPESQKLVRKALEQANGMSHLIQDMLQVFRFISGQAGAGALEKVSLNKVLEDVIRDYEMVAHAKGVHLVRGAIENVPAIMGIDTYVRQVAINLISNAIKYTNAGGHVKIGLTQQDRFVVFEVTDEGIGIPETEQSRIFTEFFRGEEAKETAYEGTGLGLVLVKHVMEGLGGSIDFTSIYHQGTTFKARFPLSA